MKDYPKIFLELNITASKEQLNVYIDAYNNRMREEHRKDYGQYTLKGNHVNAAEKLIDAFYLHLKEQATKSQSIIAWPFKVNNVALATMIGGTTVKRTSANRINRLIDAGIITEKKFLGTNTGFVLKLNPEFLVAMPNAIFSNEIVSVYEQVVNNGHPDDPEIRQKLQFLTPSFSAFPGRMGKVLPDIVTRTLQEQNINMQCGIVDNRESTAPLSQDSQINNDCVKGFAIITQEQQQEPGLQADENHANIDCENFDKKIFHAPNITVEEIGRREKILNYALLAWNFIVANLYDGRTFSAKDELASDKFLKKYFTDHAASPNELAEAFNKLVLRVILARKYTMRDPDRYIPNPRVWLDPTFEKGFAGTERWLTVVTKKQEEQKDYYANVKLVSTLYREFASNPATFNYVAARQTLGKKKNKEYLQMFDAAVLKHPLIQSIHQKMISDGIA